jgi:hypothetical protein
MAIYCDSNLKGDIPTKFTFSSGRAIFLLGEIEGGGGGGGGGGPGFTDRKLR